MSNRLPLVVTCNVLACLEGEDRRRLVEDERLCWGLFGASSAEINELLKSPSFFQQRFQYLVRLPLLLGLFEGGLKGRVRRYNRLAKRDIIKSPLRFSSLKCPFPGLSGYPPLLRQNQMLQNEPAYYYPIDEASVGYWNNVRIQNQRLAQALIGQFLRKRPWAHHHQPSTFLFENCDARIATQAYHFEHQYARALLNLNLNPQIEDESDSISLVSITSSVQSKISFYEQLAK